MKSEIVLFPNPNQVILLRELQKKICSILNEKSGKTMLAAPILPLCVKNEHLHENAKISKAVPSDTYIEENKIFLNIKMHIDKNESSGRIELCELFFENAESQENFTLKSTDFSELQEKFVAKVKKISPFRLVRLKSEEFTNGRTWRVLSEKWGKIK